MPSVDDFVEARMRDCMLYEDKDADTCERELRVRYRKTPYLTGARFLERLARDRNYLKTLTVVDSARLPEIVADLLRLPIDYFDEVDGCVSRAGAIAYHLMKTRGIAVGHVFARGSIRVRSVHVPLENAHIRWSFHIAPFVMVRDAAGKIFPYSLDLTLLRGEARPLNEWLDRLERDAPALLELHALKSFESAPREPGDAPVRSWRDRETSMIEERLRAAPVRSVHRGSPVRADLAPEFERILETAPLEIRNPYESVHGDPAPVAFHQAFSPALQETLRARVRGELRCEGNRCAVHYRDEAGHGFCRIQTEIPRAATDRDLLRIDCLPFDR